MSADLLTSKFVKTIEIPRAALAAKRADTTIACLYVRPCAARSFRIDVEDPEGGRFRVRVTDYQGINDPSKPLMSLPEGAEREQVLAEAAGEIVRLAEAQISEFAERKARAEAERAAAERRAKEEEAEAERKAKAKRKAAADAKRKEEEDAKRKAEEKKRSESLAREKAAQLTHDRAEAKRALERAAAERTAAERRAKEEADSKAGEEAEAKRKAEAKREAVVDRKRRAEKAEKEEYRILEVLRSFRGNPDFYVEPDIPPKKAASARIRVGLPTEARVLGLIDLTRFGSAKSCWLFGETAIYYNRYGDRQLLLYSELPSLNFKSAFLGVHIDEKRHFSLAGSSFPRASAVALLKTLGDSSLGLWRSLEARGARRSIRRRPACPG